MRLISECIDIMIIRTQWNAQYVGKS